MLASWESSRLAPGLRHQDLAQRLEVLDTLAGPQRHRVERVVGHVDRHARLFPPPLLKPTPQRAATGQRDAAVHDVTGELGRALVQRGLHGVDDHGEWFLNRAPDLLGGDDDRFRQPAHQVTAADLGVRLVRRRERGPQRHLDLLGGPLAQHERVLLLAEGDDGLVQFVTADPDRLRGHDPAEGDDRHLGGAAAAVYPPVARWHDPSEADDPPRGGAAADVYHHVSRWLVHRQPGTDRRVHRLLDDVHAPRAGLVTGFLDRALLDAGDAAGHRDDDARLSQVAAFVHLLDEVSEHSLGDVEIRYHAVFQGPDRNDVAGRSADHAFGFHSDGDDLPRVRVQSHHRWLIEHDSTSADVDQCVRSAEIDRHIAAEERQRVAHVERRPSRWSCRMLLNTAQDLLAETSAHGPSSFIYQRRAA